MPPATGTEGDGAVRRNRHRASRTPRLARTLVAFLGVASMVVTAAAADPAGLRVPVSDVFAAGEGGLGRLEAWVDLPADAPTDARGARTDGSDAAPAGDEVLAVGDVADPLAGLGEPFGGPGGKFLASAVPSGLAGGDVPVTTLRAYRAAAAVLAREQPGCGIDWALLAAIGRVESDHGRFGGATVSAEGLSVPAVLGVRLDGSLVGTMVITDSDRGALDGDVEFDRAVGPMQFLPGTWQRWGSDGDRDGVSDPQDVDDAALAAARYLCSGAGGLDRPESAAAAVRRYNNSTEYVQLVLATAGGYREGGPGAFPVVTDVGPSPLSFPSGPGWTPPARSGTGPVLVRAAGSRPLPSAPVTTSPAVRPSASVVPAPTARPTPSASTGSPTAPPGTASPTTRPSTAVPSTAVPSTAVPSPAVPSPAVPSTDVPSPTGTVPAPGRPSPSATTVGPTATPSTVPTATPSATPSGTASVTPSATPSDSPSATPSGTPSVTPDPSTPDPTCEPVPAPSGSPVPSASFLPSGSPTATGPVATGPAAGPTATDPGGSCPTPCTDPAVAPSTSATEVDPTCQTPAASEPAGTPTAPPVG